MADLLTQTSGTVVEYAHFDHGTVDATDVLEDLVPVWGTELRRCFETCDDVRAIDGAVDEVLGRVCFVEGGCQVLDQVHATLVMRGQGLDRKKLGQEGQEEAD